MSEDLSAWRGPIAPPNAAELADRYALGQLCKVYALGVDMQDYELTRSVFSADAYADSATMGSAPIDEYLPKVYNGAGSYQATQHNILNQHIVVNGDEAIVWNYAMAVHKAKPEDPRDHLTVGLQYRDTCKRTPRGWLITHRKTVWYWQEKYPNEAKA